MATQQRPHRRTRLANILAMASAASAMSLSNFQLITSSEVSLGCILAYNAPILGCSTATDFTQGPQGNVCSAGCKRALESAQENLASVCAGVNVPSSSVLGRALSGGLVELLCPSSSGQGPATTGGESPAVVVTTQTSSATRQIGTFSPIPTPNPTTLRTSTTTSTADDTSDAESETSTSEADAEPTVVAETTEVAPVPVLTSSAGKPTHTTSAQQTKPAPQTASNDTPHGGGSPFDIARVTSGAQRLSVRWVEGFLFVITFVFLLLR